MRVAVCFYGITRCLQKTLPSIEESLFGPLLAAGVDLSVFLHCLTMESVTNERSGELDCQLDPNEWRMLCPAGPNALAEPQEAVDEKLEHEIYRKQPDPWGDGYVSMKNHVRALYSQARALELVPSPLSFDAIISARPDILYPQPFDPKWVPFGVKKPTICIPAFGTFGGLNDRFAVGSPAAMVRYMLRGHDYRALHLSSAPGQHKKLTGEKFLAKWVKERRLKVRRLEWTFARMRANGEISERDAVYVPNGLA
jgi:hypothetical protein